MSSLIFNPIIPITIASVFLTIMLVIVFVNRKHVINRVLILVLIFIISQRPMILKQDDSTYALNLDVIFVVDTTLGMLGDDVKTAETKIDLTKKLINKIIDSLAGSRFAIITHDNAAYVKYPFTFNSAAVASVVDSLDVVEGHYAAGSNISRPVTYMKMLLNSSIITSDNSKANRKKIVFMFGDGETDASVNKRAYESLSEKLGMYGVDLNISDEEDIAKYEGLNELIDGGAVFGTGTKEGGKLVARGKYKDNKYTAGGKYLISYGTQKPFIAYLNEETLKAIASNMGIEYMNAESNKFDKKIEEIKGLTEEEVTQDKIKKASDIYYYLTGILTGLLVYELYYYRRNEL